MMHFRRSRPLPRAAFPRISKTFAFQRPSRSHRIDPHKEGFFHRAHGNVSRPPETLRSHAPFRDHAHRRPRQSQSKEADRDMAAGKYRGPLHGLPWGAKGSARGQGIPHHLGRRRLRKSEIRRRRHSRKAARRSRRSSRREIEPRRAGHERPLVRRAKPAIPGIPHKARAALPPARHPLQPRAAWRSAIGSETLGSISSPSTRCGCTGLRPTFGFVPRTGAMALSWSMDKLGPICRAVEDCAFVLHAIYGPDGSDRAVQPAAFNWNADLDWHKLRVGYLKTDFEPRPEHPKRRREEPESELSAEEKKSSTSKNSAAKNSASAR